MTDREANENTLLNQNLPDIVPKSSTFAKKRQVLATVCATLGCLLNGAAIGYTGPALPSLLNITGDTNDGHDIWGDSLIISAQEASWITGLLSIGSLMGCLIAGVTIEVIGRKKTLMYLTSSSYFLGFLCIFLANSTAVIFVGRFLNGLGLGFVLSTSTIYIVEIASTDMRGVLGCFIQFMGGFGVLLTFILGYWCNWWQLSGTMMLIVIPFVIGMSFVPETPHWYYSKGRDKEGEIALNWLHGDDQRSIDYELENIKTSLKQEKENSMTLKLFMEKSILKPFLVAFIMFVFLNSCGLNIMIFYCNTIFKYSGSKLDSKIAAIIVGIILLVSSFLAILVITKLTRKVILIGSLAGMCICYAVLGGCFFVIEENFRLMKQGLPTEEFNLGWVPPLAILLLLFLGNGGYGTLVWVVAAEILPPRIRSKSNSVNICFSFVLGFLASKTFVDLVLGMGASGTFWLYAAVCFLGATFTFFFVPETKGKTIEEIQKIFAK